MLCVFCAPCSSSNDQPPSKAVKRATVTPSSIAAVRRGKREVCLNSCLDLNGNFRPSSPVAGDFWEETKAQSCHAENRTVLEDVRLSSEQNQHCISEGRRKIWLLTSISFLLESSHSRLYFGSVSEMHRLNWMSQIKVLPLRLWASPVWARRLRFSSSAVSDWASHDFLWDTFKFSI